MLEVFLEAPGLEALASLRRVMASGEALPPQLVRRFFARLAQAELHNLYGPTEASVDVSFWPCVPEPPGDVVPIGRPIANHRLHVLDRDSARRSRSGSRASCCSAVRGSRAATSAGRT